MNDENPDALALRAPVKSGSWSAGRRSTATARSSTGTAASGASWRGSSARTRRTRSSPRTTSSSRSSSTRSRRSPYREVMARVLERLGAPAEERDALGRSLPSWAVFPEVPRALEQARARGWRLCILSNTDRDFIDASMTAIGVPFDRVDRRVGDRLVQAGSRPLAGVREGRGPAAGRPRGREPLPRRRADVGARHPLLLDQPARRRRETATPRRASRRLSYPSRRCSMSSLPDGVTRRALRRDDAALVAELLDEDERVSRP